MLSTAIAAVLNRSLGKLSWLQAVVKFLISGANCQDWGSVRHRPTHGIGVAAASAGSTNVLSSRPFLISISSRATPSIVTVYIGYSWPW